MISPPKSGLEPPPPGTATPSTSVALSASVSSDGYLSPPSVETLAPSPAPSSKIVDDRDEPPLPTLVRERSHGAKMRDGEAALELPHNNMYLVMTALALCMFLAALDQTIVSTALPSISADLGGSGSDYQWIGTAYLLTTAAFVPMWGRLSDVVGRKWTFYPAILIFAGGSAICAASQSMKMLIGARALQGIGGGGISTMVQIVLSDIVTLEQRGKYSAVMGATWGFASIAGPLFGGLLSDRATWRWCFLINLPTVAVAITMLWFFLHLNPHHKLSFAEFYAQFDFVGVLLLMAGTATLLAGFSLAGEGVWSEPKVIALLVVGVALLALGALNECYTKRLAIIPPRLMKTRTTVLIFAITLIHGMCFINLTFYLPVYYQGVFGASALLSGIQMLPVVLGGSVLSFIGGPILTIFKKPRPFFWISTSLTCLGLGLMLLLDENSSISQQEGLPVIAGLAVSMLFQPPLIALQSAMPLKDMGTSTGAFLLFRMIGSAIGISIGGTILLSQLHARLAPIPNLPASVINDILGGDYTSIKRISDDQGLQTEVRRALSSSVRTIWVVLCPMMGLAFIFSLFLRHYTLTRNYTSANKSGTAKGVAGEQEKQAVEQDEDEEEKPTPEGKKKDAWASAEEGGGGRELD